MASKPIDSVSLADDSVALGAVLDLLRPMLIHRAHQELGSDLRGKIDPDDIVQDSLLKAFCAFDRFRGTTEAELIVWLCRIVHSTTASVRRRFHAACRDVARELPIEVTPPDENPRHPITPSSGACQNEEKTRLATILEQLTEEYRRVIRLHYFEGLTDEAIGRVLGCTPEAARSLRRRARSAVGRATVG